ncbi:MAG: hypothetical protein HY761_05215 [Candidatus Omnitrophica bacterium]|nr:hypothetical protein [Candidatus Omnitrophota bacterium]
MKWLTDLLMGGIGGMLSGLAVNFFSNKSKKKELRRISLEFIKINLEEYKKRTECVAIDIMSQCPLDDEKTQTTRKELENIFIEIRKDLIYCPKRIRRLVIDFDKMRKGKDTNLSKAVLEFKHRSSATVCISEEINKFNNIYNELMKEINILLN